MVEFASRDRAGCARIDMLREYVLLARQDSVLKIQSRTGSVHLEFMAVNAIVNICTKCCSAVISKEHFAVLSVKAANVMHGTFLSIQME